MTLLQSLGHTVRRLRLERFGELRPRYPTIAVELDRRDAVLVRLRRRGRGHARLEAHAAAPLPDGAVGPALFRPTLTSPQEMTKRISRLFEATGTRPGKVTLVVPDNLARVSLVQLPERPASRKHLVEILRFKLRRTVPFRLDEALLAHEILPGDGPGIQVLVALVLRSVVEQYEGVIEAAGARPGLVELCSLSLFNLCRASMTQLAQGGRDVALLNYTPAYFTLLITRGGRLLFYRCKSLPVGEQEVGDDGVVSRELATSLSYYQEKLSGQGLEAVLLRSVGKPVEELAAMLGRLGVDRVLPVDPAEALSVGGAAVRLEPEVRQQIAPGVGAVLGRLA